MVLVLHVQSRWAVDLLSFIFILEPKLTLKPLFGILPEVVAEGEGNTANHTLTLNTSAWQKEQNGFSEANSSVQQLCHLLVLNIGILHFNSQCKLWFTRCQ